MLIILLTIILYFSIIAVISLFLKYSRKNKTTHNPYYGYWFDFTVLSVLPLFPFLWLISHFRKPNNHEDYQKVIDPEDKTISTHNEYVNVIEMFMGSDIEWQIIAAMAEIKISIQRNNSIGFNRNLEMLKRYVDRNKIHYVRVKWFVVDKIPENR